MPEGGKPPRPGSLGDPELRDKLVPKHATPPKGIDAAAPQSQWHEEKTGVHTDPQVFRALKAMREEFIAALTGLRKVIEGIVRRVDNVERQGDETRSLADQTSGRVDVLVQQPRTRTESSGLKAVTAHLLLERQETRDDVREERAKQAKTLEFTRAVKLKVIGGAIALLTSAAFLGWLFGRHG